MKKYSDIVSKKNNFGGTQGSWAQKQIMRSARKLSDSGELVLGGGDFV